MPIILKDLNKTIKTREIMNHDDTFLGTENPSHPANLIEEIEFTEIGEICEKYNLPDNISEVLLSMERNNERLRQKVNEQRNLLSGISKMLDNTNNGIAILCKNNITNFLNKNKT